MSNLNKIYKYLSELVINSYKKAPKLSASLVSFGIGMAILKLYKVKQDNALEFELTKENISSKVVLITRCGSGIGKAIAIALNKYGFTIIATCRRQESVDEYLNNKLFMENGSIAFKLDVSNINDIRAIKIKVSELLGDQNKILWSIINNAGVAVFTPFEIQSTDAISLQINVNLLGGMNICHNFIPLLYGRQNVLKYNTTANGGRIIFISSTTAFLPIGGVYGVTKVGISRVANMLRLAAFEVAEYRTNMTDSTRNADKHKELWETANNRDNIDKFYRYDIENKMAKDALNVIEYMYQKNYDTIIKDAIHCLTKKYPKRVYRCDIDYITETIAGLVTKYNFFEWFVF